MPFAAGEPVPTKRKVEVDTRDIARYPTFARKTTLPEEENPYTIPRGGPGLGDTDHPTKRRRRGHRAPHLLATATSPKPATPVKRHADDVRDE